MSGLRFTGGQERMLRRTVEGVIWTSLNPEDLSILQYLSKQGLCQPRVDIQDNMYRITEAGKSVLAAQDKEREEHAKADAKDAEQKIERIQERKQDRRDKWLVGILSACCISILTLCVEHFDKLLVFLGNLFH